MYYTVHLKKKKPKNFQQKTCHIIKDFILLSSSCAKRKLWNKFKFSIITFS